MSINHFTRIGIAATSSGIAGNELNGQINKHNLSKKWGKIHSHSDIKVYQRTVEFGLPKFMTDTLDRLGMTHHFVVLKNGDERGQGANNRVPLEGNNFDCPGTQTAIVCHKGQALVSTKVPPRPIEAWYYEQRGLPLDLDSQKFNSLMKVDAPKGRFGALKQNTFGSIRPNLCYETILEAADKSNRNHPNYKAL